MHTLDFIDSHTGGEPTRVVFAGFPDLGTAKLATRCGMGACQGRCGSALAEFDRFPRSGRRPPLFPARLSTLGDIDLSSCHHQGSSA